MDSWGIVYHRLQTINLYRIALKHIRFELIPRSGVARTKPILGHSVGTLCLRVLTLYPGPAQL